MSQSSNRLDQLADVRVSVIIPSWDASRNANISLLKADIAAQTFQPVEVCVVEQVSPNGHARNVGVERTLGDILVFLDDDVRLGSDTVFETLAACLRSEAKLGLAGTAQQLPPDSSTFQQMCAQQLSRSHSPVVHELTESDMVTTQCCAVRRSVLGEVGGFHDRIRRGVDPELRNRMRQAGYRVAVAQNIWHYHPMPASLKALLRMAWRDGAASAYARKHFPETVLFNPEGHVSDFKQRSPLPVRIIRNAARLLANTLSGKWYGTAYGVVYAAANITGQFRK